MRDYDFVLSGHSHYSHCFCEVLSQGKSGLRNKKAVTFYNPGSVGLPKEIKITYTVYFVLSFTTLKKVGLRVVAYDVKFEQSLFQKGLTSSIK